MAKKILLVEDEKILVEMYKEKLIQAGFEVFLAFESKEGLDLAKKEKPDLIILDILLPRENGIAFLNWIRKEKEIAQIPVVIFSNYDDPKTKREALELGAKDYLIKTNYTPSEVVMKVKQILNVK